MDKHRIYTQKGSAATHADKIALASLLVKTGYTVRLGKEKKGSSTTTFVEYWEEKENGN